MRKKRKISEIMQRKADRIWIIGNFVVILQPICAESLAIEVGSGQAGRQSGEKQAPNSSEYSAL
ncbi:MAG: hypothetical protein MR293_05340 [Bacteroidales bacterium]|nr:hypothetical protein [Bacteroidales bacterium]